MRAVRKATLPFDFGEFWIVMDQVCPVEPAEAKFPDAGGVDDIAARLQRNHARLSGGVPSCVTELTDLCSTELHAGLNGIEQR